MKLLFFIDILSSGGKERRLTELVKALKLRPDCSFELAIMSKEIHYREILDLDIPIHYIIRKRKKDIFVFRELFKLCRSYKPDIIHCWDSMTAIYSVPVCKFYGIKLVNGMITNAPERQNINNKHWFRAKLTFPFSDVIIGNSQAGLTAYRAPKGKSLFIHNGFNFERIEGITDRSTVQFQLGIKTRYLIGMVANYSKNKDYKTFFSAAQIILDKRKDVTFLAIGKDTDSSISKAQIKTEYLEYFRFLGMMHGVESFTNAMDICILSTFTEGISNSILEYMALGKPVIATSGGGTCEIVKDKKSGFLVKASEPEELASKMEILLDNDELRNGMGLAGRERIKENFTIEKMVGRYIFVYNKILSNYKPEVSLAEKILRESFAFMLIQFYSILNSKNKKKGILSAYWHNPRKELFEKTLKWLSSHGYEFISIQELDSLIYGKKPTSKKVFISCDDGWQGNLELVKSIEKYKVPITIFVPTDSIIEGNYWWEYSKIKGQQKYSGIRHVKDFKKLPEKEFYKKMEILKQNYKLNRSCMTLDELLMINKNSLITIGSHSISHPILIQCSEETQRNELTGSKLILKKWLKKEVDYFAYPNGDYNDDTAKLTGECGYRLGFTTNTGRINVSRVNPYAVPRNALYDWGGYYENIAKLLGLWQKFIH